MQKISQQDYLRAIYTLGEDNLNKRQGIKSVKLAEFLGISKPGVSQMLKKLAEDKLIESNPYSNICLTSIGYKKAKKSVYNYRVIEVFLKKILDYQNNDVKLRHEAHKLEHAFSDKSIKKLDNFLKNPKKCPHGNKICR